MISSEERKAIPMPAIWIILGLLLAFLAYVRVEMIASPKDMGRDQNALREFSRKYNDRFKAASSEVEQTRVFKKALETLSPIKMETKGGAGAKARFMLILRRELDKESNISDLKFSTATDDAPADMSEEELKNLARSRKKLNESLLLLYGSAPPERQQARRLVSDIIENSSGNWPYSLAIKRARVLAAERSKLSDVGPGAVSALAGSTFLLGCAMAGLFLILTGVGRWRAVGVPLLGQDAATADSLGVRMLAYLVLFSFGSALFVPLITTFAAPGWVDVTTGFVMLPLFLLLFNLPFLNSPLTMAQIGLRLRPLLRQVGAGIAGFLITVPLVVLAVQISGRLLPSLPGEEHPISRDLADPSRVLPAFLAAVIFAPIVEELFFRGCLFQGILVRTRRLWLAVILSSIAFAAIHPQGAESWLPLATVGAVAAGVYYHTGSMLATITMHALWNFTVLSAAVFGLQARLL